MVLSIYERKHQVPGHHRVGLVGGAKRAFPPDTEVQGVEGTYIRAMDKTRRALLFADRGDDQAGHAVKLIVEVVLIGDERCHSPAYPKVQEKHKAIVG